MQVACQKSCGLEMVRRNIFIPEEGSGACITQESTPTSHAPDHINRRAFSSRYLLMVLTVRPDGGVRIE